MQLAFLPTEVRSCSEAHYLAYVSLVSTPLGRLQQNGVNFRFSALETANISLFSVDNALWNALL